MTTGADRGNLGPAWDEELTSRWLAHLERREAPLRPVSDALFERAKLSPGMTVLDVGCGAGPTTMEAARRVAPNGRVTGVDISPGMIQAARDRAADLEIEWLVADVEQHVFEPGTFDAVISRFGVMFFANPVRAFENLAMACRTGARLVMAVWPERDKSEFFTAPLRVLARTLDRLGATFALPPVDAPPFTLGKPENLNAVLASSGWSDVEIVRDHRILYLAGPGSTAEQAAESVLDLGVPHSLLEGQPPAVFQAARADLIEDFSGRHDGAGVGLAGGSLIVSARRGDPPAAGANRYHALRVGST